MKQSLLCFIGVVVALQSTVVALPADPDCLSLQRRGSPQKCGPLASSTVTSLDPTTSTTDEIVADSTVSPNPYESTTADDIVTDYTVSPNPYEITTTTTDDIVTDSTVSPNPYESSTTTTEDMATSTEPVPEPTTTSDAMSTTAPTKTFSTPTPTPTSNCDLTQATRKYRINVYNGDVSKKDSYRESVLAKLSAGGFCYIIDSIDANNNYIYVSSYDREIMRMLSIQYLTGITIIT
ncbi:hypothetical protein H4R33_004361 [Dimargaris cristalligena]|nr:hypothetical protein H4R33_004361 [Dimargaris cristalligena]